MYVDYFQTLVPKAMFDFHHSTFNHPLLNTIAIENVLSEKQPNIMRAAYPPSGPIQGAPPPAGPSTTLNPANALPGLPTVAQPYDDVRTAYDDTKAAGEISESGPLRWLRYQRLRGRTPPPAWPPTLAPCTLREKTEETNCLTFVHACQDVAAQLKLSIRSLREQIANAKTSPLSPPGIY